MAHGGKTKDVTHHMCDGLLLTYYTIGITIFENLIDVFWLYFSAINVVKTTKLIINCNQKLWLVYKT